MGLVDRARRQPRGRPGHPAVKHMFVGSKADWYTITDDLPQHEEYPPEFGMPVDAPRP